MTRRNGFWVGAALLLFAGGAALLTVELIQRNRYEDAERRMGTALEAFQKRARLSITKEFTAVVVSGDVPTTAAFRMDYLPDLSPWILKLVSLDQERIPTGALQVRKLTRRRTILLRSPVFQVDWVDMHATNSVIALFDAVMREHGVSYQFEWPDK